MSEALDPFVDAKLDADVCTDDASTRGRRLHPVWEYFKVLENNSMVCLKCGRAFKTTGSTTVCKHHLRSRHPDIFAQLAAEELKDWRLKGTHGTDIENVDDSMMKRLWQDFVKADDFFNDEKLLIVESVRDRPAIWKHNNSEDVTSNTTEADFSEIALNISTKLKSYTGNDVQACWNSLREAYKCAKLTFSDEEWDMEIDVEHTKQFFEAMSFLDSVLPIADHRMHKFKPRRSKQRKLNKSDDFSEKTFPPISDVNNNHNDVVGIDLPQNHRNFDYFKSLYDGALVQSHVISPAVDIVASLLNHKQHMPQQTAVSFASPSSIISAAPAAVNSNFTTAGLLSPSINSMTMKNGGVSGDVKQMFEFDKSMDESSPLGALVVDLHRKLRDNNKHKAMEFKKSVFNLVSEFEMNLL